MPFSSRLALIVVPATSARVPTGRFGVRLLRYALLGTLTVGLLYLGLDPGPWQAVLTRAAAAVLPLPVQHALQQHTPAQVTARSLPGMFLYSLSYCALAGLLTALALGAVRQLPHTLRRVATAYGLGFALCVAGLVLGYAGLTGAWPLVRRLIDLLVSPLPVVVLIALYHRLPAGPTRPAS